MKPDLVKLNEDKIHHFTDLLFEFFRELREKQGWRPPSKNKISQDAKQILESNDIVILAYMDGIPAGFIRISTRHEKSVFWIEEIFVKPEFRGRGIARTLVEAAENEVLNRGEVSLYLFVLPQEKDALHFWKSVGYTILNSIELVKDLKTIKRDEKLLPIELIGEKFEIFRWEKQKFDELETEFLNLLEKFYSSGGDKRKFLSLVNGALRDYLER